MPKQQLQKNQTKIPLSPKSNLPENDIRQKEKTKRKKLLIDDDDDDDDGTYEQNENNLQGYGSQEDIDLEQLMEAEEPSKKKTTPKKKAAPKEVVEAPKQTKKRKNTEDAVPAKVQKATFELSPNATTASKHPWVASETGMVHLLSEGCDGLGRDYLGILILPLFFIFSC